ncbi:MAG: M14-type cytosolic carboxypeptidase, partial [bacterium]
MFLRIVISAAVLLGIALLTLLFSQRWSKAEKNVLPVDTGADFESGAVQNVHQGNDGMIAFQIPEDPGSGEYLWFYFAVATRSAEPLEFIIENAAGAHQTGKRWNITRPVFSADGKTWVRTEETQYAHLETLLKKPVFYFQAPI